MPLGADNGFSASVLAADKNQVILEKGYGLADCSLDTRIMSDTVFYVGSNSKQFIAKAVLYLKSQGLLIIHAPIKQKYHC